MQRLEALVPPHEATASVVVANARVIRDADRCNMDHTRMGKNCLNMACHNSRQDSRTVADRGSRRRYPDRNLPL